MGQDSITEKNEDLYYWLSLKFVPEIGDQTSLRLIARFKGPKDIFFATNSELKEAGLNSRQISNLKNFSQQKRVEKELEEVRTGGINILTILDKEYPKNLLHIYNPPPLLYLKGYADILHYTAFSIVGSRNASRYGLEIAENFSRDLARRGFVIVSGMARGIDSAAHRGALAGGGKTIAVFGSGLDQVYPWENRPLAMDITKKGALVTEYAMGTPPLGKNFPPRNRIISGLSVGTIIVEAGPNSGSLITANFALEQGREIFAVPGEVTSIRAKGTNDLIQQGAKLVGNVDHILEEFPEELFSKVLPPSVDASSKGAGVADNKIKEKGQEILDLIGSKPVCIDDIISKAPMDTGQILGILLELEIKGLIRQMEGKFFSRT